MGNYRPTSATTWLCCIVLLYLTIQIAEVNSSSTPSSSVSTQQAGSSSATPASTTAPTAAPTPAPTTASASTEKQSSKIPTTTTSQATTVTTTSTQSTVAASTGTTTTTETPALGVNCTNKPDDWCNTTVSGAVECREDKCQCRSGHFQSDLTTCTPELDLVPRDPVTSDVTTTSFGISWSQRDSVKGLALNHNVTAKPAYVGNTIREVTCNVTSDTTASCSGLESGYKYNVTITVTYNSVHSGHNIKLESTYPDTPGAINDTRSNLTAPDVTLVWTGSTGRVDLYTIEVRQSDGLGPVQNTTNGTPEIVISALEAGKRYNATITAHSYSKPSEERMDTFRTVSEEPGPPRNVTVTSVSNSSIKISWLETDQPNGDILEHQVCVKYKFYMNESYGHRTCNNTSTLEYEDNNLSAGTFYQFDVYTVNDVSTSSNASVYQRTNSTVPAHVSGLDAKTNDTLITVTWSRPLRPNGDIIAYSVYWLDTATNRNCTVYLTSVESTNMTSSCNHNITEPASITVNQGNLEYTIINLEPHTVYIIRVAAYTSEGAGAIDAISKETSVAVPDPVTNVMADPLNATAVNVSWTISTVNPGPVNYTVTANNMIDNTGSTQSCSVEGYNMSNCEVSGLEEYWIYSFSVVASTDAGTSSPFVSGNVTTEEAEPGPVSNSSYKLYITTPCDATRVTFMWKEPLLHDRNSRIVKYEFLDDQSRFEYFVVSDPDRDLYSPDNRRFVKDLTNLNPEFAYKWEIWAKSTRLSGQRSSISFTTGVCAPPNWADSDLQAVKETRSTTTSLTIVLPSSFFKRNEQGTVHEKGLIILPRESDYFKDTGGMKHTELKDWSNSKSYQFVKDYKIHITVDDVGEEFTIGQETECSKTDNGNNFCNGPLPEQFSFKVAAYACTKRSGTLLCTISRPVGPYATQAKPVPSESSESTLAIVLSIIFVLMACVAAFTFLWYKDIIDPKSWFSKKDADNDDDEYFTQLDKIDRTRPIKIWRYSAELEEMHRDTNLILSDQYDDINKIGQMVAESSTTDASKLESNTPKNRWVNILPFDHSRVKLQQIDDDDPTSDYINANYMPGFNNKREYIATQGPLPGTIDDFWRMVWEHDVMVIVMLTQCKEGNRVKCEKYWPDELREPKQYGEVVVNPISISQLDKYNISIFDVSVNGESRQVIHFHYLDFPDFSANVEFDHFINFVRTVRNHVPHDMTGPMVIHCSAGVGRTGTFIATDRLNLYLNSPKFDENDDVDIFGIVVSMRENRVAMVQTESQYIMIHDCFVKMLEDKRKSMQVTDSTENLYENQGFDPYPEVLYENVTTTAQQQTEL